MHKKGVVKVCLRNCIAGQWENKNIAPTSNILIICHWCVDKLTEQKVISAEEGEGLQKDGDHVATE